LDALFVVDFHVLVTPLGGLSSLPSGYPRGVAGSSEIIMEKERDERLTAIEKLTTSSSPVASSMIQSILLHLQDEDENAFQEAMCICDMDDDRWT